jgi:hypothetical protein
MGGFWNRRGSETISDATAWKCCGSWRTDGFL